jgi:RNA polymerase sigma factor (sigma-70 family)
MDDSALLEAWRGGDRLSGDRLFRRHFAAVQRFFANKISSTAVVEDLVQRTFLRCLERPSGFAGRSTFRAYLLGIARFVLFAYFRESRRHSVLTELGSMSVQAMGHGMSTLVGHNEEQQLLLQALRRIPLEQQIALELYYFEELGAGEAAGVLEIPVGTLRSRVRLGKDALRKGLAELSAPAALTDASDDDLERWLRDIRRSLPGDSEGEG